MHRGTRYNKSVLRRIAITCALGLAACGPRPGTAPASSGLKAYLQALRSDDPRPLYEMLTQDQRKAIPYKDWEANWKHHKAERTQQAAQVEERWQGPVEALAEVRFADGQIVNLHQGNEGWRLDEALVSTGSTPTPNQALGQLVAALEGKDFSALLSILSTARRESIEQRLGNFHQGLVLQSQDGAPELYLVTESRAELNWSHEDVRYRLVFVLEGANWRLDEVHMGPDPAALPEDESPNPKPTVERW